MPQDPVIYSSNLVSGITVNAPVLQQPNTLLKTVILTAAKTLTSADSGTTYVLNLAGGFTVTLPAIAAGLYFKFFVKTAPTTAYIIAAAGADADLMTGTIVTAATGATDTETTLGADDIRFIANVAVIGDSVDLWSDGTAWYARGYCSVATGITFEG